MPVWACDRVAITRQQNTLVKVAILRTPGPVFTLQCTHIIISTAQVVEQDPCSIILYNELRDVEAEKFIFIPNSKSFIIRYIYIKKAVFKCLNISTSVL